LKDVTVEEVAKWSGVQLPMNDVQYSAVFSKQLASEQLVLDKTQMSRYEDQFAVVNDWSKDGRKVVVTFIPSDGVTYSRAGSKDTTNHFEEQRFPFKTFNNEFASFTIPVEFVNMVTFDPTYPKWSDEKHDWVDAKLPYSQHPDSQNRFPYDIVTNGGGRFGKYLLYDVVEDDTIKWSVIGVNGQILSDSSGNPLRQTFEEWQEGKEPQPWLFGRITGWR
jgi:hypothetical protein